jgi:hypothetical protein
MSSATDDVLFALLRAFFQQPMYLARVPSLSLHIKFLPQYGMRIYGTLSPPETAIYYFALSADGAAEFKVGMAIVASRDWGWNALCFLHSTPNLLLHQLSGGVDSRDTHTVVTLDGQTSYAPEQEPIASQISQKASRRSRKGGNAHGWADF